MFGKARSKAELQQLKNEYLANLQVEIENQSVLEKKIRKPDEAPPVPLQYKTETELRGDIQAIDNQLIQTIMNDIGYGYSSVIQVISDLATDDKIKLLALYPQFKASIAKDGIKTRLRLLDPAFINQKIKQFLQITNKSQGTSNLAGIPATVEDLQEMMPTEDDIVSVIQTISNQGVINMIGAKKFEVINRYLRKYLGIYPTLDQVNSFKTSKLNNTTRTILAGDLGRLMLDYKMITKQDLNDIKSGIVELFDEGRGDEVGEFIEGKLGGANDKALRLFANNWKTTLATAGGENLPPTDDLDEVSIDFGALSGAEIQQNAEYLKRFKDQQDQYTIKRDKQGNIYQRVKTKLDDETSTIASSMSEDIRSLAEFGDDDQSRSLAEDLNSVLSEKPSFALRLQVLERKTLNDAGYRNVDDIRDPNEARSLLSVLHSAVDTDLRENIGMTIEEVEEGEFPNVLDQQSALARFEEERLLDRYRDEFDLRFKKEQDYENKVFGDLVQESYNYPLSKVKPAVIKEVADVLSNMISALDIDVVDDLSDKEVARLKDDVIRELEREGMSKEDTRSIRDNAIIDNMMIELSRMGFEDVNVAEPRLPTPQEVSRKGDLIEDVFSPFGELQDAPLPSFGEIRTYDNLEKWRITSAEVEDRVRNLVSSVRFTDLQDIIDDIYGFANANYGVKARLPPELNPRVNSRAEVVNMILGDVMTPILDLIAFNSKKKYNPDENKLFDPNKYNATRDQGLMGFGAKPKSGRGQKPLTQRPNVILGKGKKPKQGIRPREDEMMGSGSLTKGRISVKKLVGRGIEVEQQPTYKKFGKYVMHYPHLINNNVFNVKYPSLGSIPAIKPKTITDDYKEFVLDIFDSGKMNERLFNTLDDDEKTHFHKVCKGAGLLELFKLKKGDTDEERDDLDRFNLLKGSFVAGNNSESVVRELRSLITKFIHEGRITKNEGLSLLMEIK